MDKKIYQTASLIGKACMSKNNGYYVQTETEIPSEKQDELIRVNGNFYLWEDE